MPNERLNRYISLAAGVSRRTADEMIRNGRVTIQGRQVKDPGTLWDPGRDEVRLDGLTLVPLQEELIYVMLHKPDNVVTTMKDKEGRKTAAALVGGLSARVFPVGRLDYHSTGLLLLTNDGDLAYKLTHPRFGVEKTYVAKVMGVPPRASLDVLRRGLPIDGEMTNPAQVTFIEKREGKAWVSIRIAEGRYHQVRKMFDAIGYRVMKLRRVAVGSLELSDVEPGEWRYLTAKELRDLKEYIDRRAAEVAAAGPPPSRVPHETRVEKPGEWRRAHPYVPRPKEPGAAGPAASPRDRKDERRATGPGAYPDGKARPGAPVTASGERKGPRQPKPEWKRPPKAPGGKGAFPAKPGWPKSRPGRRPPPRPSSPRPPSRGRAS